MITATCVAVNASSTPNEKTPARNATSCFTNDVAITIALETTVTLTIAHGETSVRRFRRPNADGQLAVLAE